MIVMPSTYPFPSLEAEPWEQQANCASVGRELFFTKKPSIYKLAKAVCAQCVVVDACLAASLANGDEFGVFGGTTPSERRKMRKPNAPVCTEPGCTKPHRAKGFCSRHYNVRRAS